MLCKLGFIAALLASASLTFAQVPSAALANPAANSPMRLIDLPLPAPNLLREHAEAMRVQSEIERMQRERSLMQARMAHEMAQRQMRQTMGASDLPWIVAVLDAGEKPRALLRSSSGFDMVVSVGDRIGRAFVVQSIDVHGVILASVPTQGRRERSRKHQLKFAMPDVAPVASIALQGPSTEAHSFLFPTPPNQTSASRQ